MVSTADASANVTVPGPDTTLQVVVTTPGGSGRPSSVTVPSSDAGLPNSTDWSAPASTVGALLIGGVTVIVTVSDADSAESSARSWST